MFDLGNIKGEYYNRRYGGEIGVDFIEPCLSLSRYYRRNLGSFSSQSLKWYISSIQHFVNNDVRIEILCHPQIDMITQKVLIEMESEEKRNKYINNEIIDKQLLKAAGIRKNDSGLKYGWQEEFLCYLIANEILEIRFAVPLGRIKPKDQLSGKYIELDDLKKNSYKNSKQGVSDELLHTAQFHTKLGYFKFKDGRELTFNGSANESKNAYEDSIESIDVFKGWETDFEKNKILSHKKNLQEDWNCTTEEDEKNLCFRTFKMGEEAFSLIKSRSTHERPTPRTPTPPPNGDGKDLSHKYRHQDEAVEEFLKEENGILEMATGTGKTRTAGKIINKLFDQDKIDQFIVTCYGVDLLKQWKGIFDNKEEPESILLRNKNIRITKGKEAREHFTLKPKNRGLLVSIDDAHNAINGLSLEQLSRTLIVYDEVHNLGTENRLSRLDDTYLSIGYKLGLSATPDKGEFKQEITEKLKKYVGEIIYKFGIEDAIKRGILCEFKYDQLEYTLTDEDNKKRKRLGAALKAAQNSKDYKKENLMKTLIGNVYKESNSKLLPFEKYIQSNPNILKSTIIFVLKENYGDKVMNILQEYTPEFKSYYGNTERSYLDQFIKGEIDILVTCKAISQGIDIPNLKNVILFSSDKNLSESTQRLGRCLRNPSSKDKKVATVVDFWQTPEKDKKSYDHARAEWLNQLSQIKEEVLND